MKKIILFFIFVFCLVSITQGAGAYEKNYLRLGQDPVGFKEVSGDEKVFEIQEDKYVECRGGSGKIYRGWIRAGTKLVAVPTQDSNCPPNSKCYVATRIYSCGNPLVGLTAPNGPARILFVEPISPQIETLAPQPQPVLPQQEAERITISPQPQVLPEVLPSQPVPTVRKCNQALPIITGTLSSLVGLAAKNGWTGAALGAAAGLVSYLAGTAVFQCAPDPYQAVESTALGAIGGALWGRQPVKKYYYSPAPAITPPVVNTLPPVVVR